jgi:hypothetical protein
MRRRLTPEGALKLQAFQRGRKKAIETKALFDVLDGIYDNPQSRTYYDDAHAAATAVWLALTKGEDPARVPGRKGAIYLRMAGWVKTIGRAYVKGILGAEGTSARPNSASQAAKVRAPELAVAKTVVERETKRVTKPLAGLPVPLKRVVDERALLLTLRNGGNAPSDPEERAVWDRLSIGYEAGKSGGSLNSYNDYTTVEGYQAGREDRFRGEPPFDADSET